MRRAEATVFLENEKGWILRELKSAGQHQHFYSDSKLGSKTIGRWTQEEHQRFIEGVKKYGKNWKLIEEYVGTRTGAQVRSHAQKFFNRLKREYNLPNEALKEQIPHQTSKSVRKMSDISISTNHSLANEDLEELHIKDFHNSSPSAQPVSEALTPIISVNNRQALSQGAQSVPLGSPKLAPLSESVSSVSKPSKMSEDCFTKHATSMFDIIMSKIKTSKDGINLPKLSDLVETTINRKIGFSRQNKILYQQENAFDQRNAKNISFRPHPRKISEDNILIRTQILGSRQADLAAAEFELLSKKIKRN